MAKKTFLGTPAGTFGRALALGLVLLSVSCQTNSGKTNSGKTNSGQTISGDLSSLLRGASSEIQRWGEQETEDERDVTVYSFKPEITLDALIQAVKNAGFFQARSDSYIRDWDLQSGVLRWCVSPDIDKWDHEIQFSAVGETIVYTYGFIPAPEVYWTAVEDSTFSSGTEEGEQIRAITYGGGKFVAVGVYKDGSIWKGEMAYSVDGIAWTKITDSNLGHPQSVAYGGGKFVAGGEGGKMAYSTDGVTWTAVEDSTFGNREYITRLYYGGGMFFAHGGGTRNGSWKYKTAYSTDGVTWRAVEDSALNYEINGLSYGGGRFVAVGGYNDGSGWKGRMAYSSDGISWTRVADSKLDFYPIGSIVYGGDTFAALNRWGGKMAYSLDGVTWTAVQDSTFVEDHSGGGGVAYGSGRFVAVTHQGKTAYSADGVIWTAVKDSLDGGTGDLAYGGGRFVVVGKSGKIAYSNMQE
jgi:hypothetical protein